MSATIVIADDHPIVRAGIRRILERRPDLEVIAEASDGQEAVEALLDKQPDFGILDLEMPQLTGIEVARRVRESRIGTSLVVLSVHATGTMVRSALEAGVVGYVVKTGGLSEIVEALDSVRGGARYLSAEVMRLVVDQIADPEERSQRLKTLTKREREVLKLIADGFSSPNIAAQLGVSVKTVNTHRWNLMEKLGIHKVSGLVRYAVREGLVKA